MNTKNIKENQRGDTLIEVLIAITVLGIIVAGVLATMNRSLVQILNSAERTAVRTDINTQTDLLNYVYRNDKATWNKIVSIAWPVNTGTTAQDDFKDPCRINENSSSGSNKKSGSFYLEAQYDGSGGISKVVLRENLTAAENGKNELQRATIGKGVWIDGVFYNQHVNNQRSYIDFYIRACWVPVGGGTTSSTNTQSITIARIYDYALDNNENLQTDNSTTGTTNNGCLAGNKKVNSYYEATCAYEPDSITVKLTGGTCTAGRTIIRQIRWKSNYPSESAYTAWADVTGNTFTLESPHPRAGQIYTFQQRFACSDAQYTDGWDEKIPEFEYRIDIDAPTPAPTVSNVFEASNKRIVFTRVNNTKCFGGTVPVYQRSTRLNTNAWSSWSDWTSSLTYPWGSLELDNSYSVRAQASCKNETTNASSQWSVGAASTYTIPNITASTPVVGTSFNTSNNTITYGWSSTCNPASGATVAYQTRTQVDTGAWTAWVAKAPPQTWTVSTTANYTVQVQAKCIRTDINASGAWSGSGSATYKYESDKVKPTVSATNSSTVWKNANVGAVVSAADNAGGSGLEGVRYQVGSDPFTDLNTCKTKGTATSNGATITVSTTGGTTLYLCAYDKAGNYTEWSGTYRIDKTAPTCTSSGGNAAWTNGNRTLTGTCSDAGGSGCVGNVSKAYTANTNSTTQSPGVVKDNAGNQTTCPANQTVRIDKTAPSAPTINMVFGNWAPYTNGAWTKEWIYAAHTQSNIPPISTDAGGSGIAKYQIRTPDAPYNNWMDFSYDISSGVYVMTGAGTHYRYFRAIDKAGNVSATTTKTIRIENVGLSCYHSNSRGWVSGNYGNTEARWQFSTPGSGLNTADWTGFYANLGGYNRFWVWPGENMKTSGFTVYAGWDLGHGAFAAGRNGGWGDGYIRSNALNIASCSANF